MMLVQASLAGFVHQHLQQVAVSPGLGTSERGLV